MKRKKYILELDDGKKKPTRFTIKSGNRKELEKLANKLKFDYYITITEDPPNFEAPILYCNY